MSEVLVWVIIVGAMLAMGLAMLRMVLGPSQADRIVALDVLFSSNIALMVGVSLSSGRTLYLDVAVGIALIGFVATIVWARLIDASFPASKTGKTR